jgi:hypothetical protein
MWPCPNCTSAALAQCKRFFSRRPLRRKGKNKKNIVSDAGSNPNYGHTHTLLANLELGEIVKKRPRSTRGPQIHLLIFFR